MMMKKIFSEHKKQATYIAVKGFMKSVYSNNVDWGKVEKSVVVKFVTWSL